ncbi:MAG TPA: hypothetical protein DD473_01235 [Planctomycetaceae bacterium]|nr:hypothetical protein [Planctomycetaceae bacterium]
MDNPLRIGDTGKTVGSLKPAGKIEVNQKIFEARSEGNWIDSDTKVVIAGGESQCPIVRAFDESEFEITNQGELLAESKVSEITPLEYPSSWVEKVNYTLCGVIFGVLIIGYALISGEPLTLSAFFLPVAGGISGRILQRFVAMPAEVAAPRENHQTQAEWIAATCVAFTMLGVLIAVTSDLGFPLSALCLFAGTLTGGLISWFFLLVGNV